MSKYGYEEYSEMGFDDLSDDYQELSWDDTEDFHDAAWALVIAQANNASFLEKLKITLRGIKMWIEKKIGMYEDIPF